MAKPTKEKIMKDLEDELKEEVQKLEKADLSTCYFAEIQGYIQGLIHGHKLSFTFGLVIGYLFSILL